ncbi:hypothetical protein HY464_03025 [Candidatus Peregrinibacteria bacterium]|nr:hypothetical protein [Candidatus Peregrinibacteria bacterium]
MRFGFAWAEWDVLKVLILPLVVLQVFVLGFLSVNGAERLLLSREPAFLELREGHTVSTAQELLVFLRHFPPVFRATYRTREQQLLTLQSMFPDTRSPEGDSALFRDALLVHVRTEQGYRSLLGALMVEPKWQELVTPSALTRMGEQVQKMQSIGTALRLLRICFLGAILAISCVLLFSLLRRVRQAYGIDEENGKLQEYLGAPFLSIVGPVAYRLTIVVSVGFLLSLLVTPFAMKLMQILA